MINESNSLALFGLMVILAWLGLFIEKTRLGRITTGIVWTMVIAIVLSNIGITPKKAATFDFIGQYLVPLSIPLFLFQVNLRTIFQDSGRMMLAFLVSAIATGIGAVVAALLFDLGPLESDLAGIFAASYTGGSLNFVATAEALDVREGTFLAAAIAADSLTGSVYLVFLALAPVWAFLTRRFVTEDEAAYGDSAQDSQAGIDVNSMSAALALSFLICIVGYQLAAWINLPAYGILCVSALALIPGTVFPNVTKKLAGSFDVGVLFAYIFFASIGAQSDVSTLFSVAPSLIAFSIVIVACHALILFPIAATLKLSLAETITASNAAILGPTTAAAMAAARGWRYLITPGLMVGIFGYAVGTFIGVALAATLSRIGF